MAKSAVSCVLVGTRNVDELTENLKTVNYVISPELEQKLDQVTLSLRDQMGSNADYFWATRTHWEKLTFGTMKTQDEHDIN